MAQRRLAKLQDEEILSLAAERVELPTGKFSYSYHADADILAIHLKDHPQPTRTEDDMDRGLVFNYEGKQLVSIEVLDLYGTFV
jgi:hypothetical protein